MKSACHAVANMTDTSTLTTAARAVSIDDITAIAITPVQAFQDDPGSSSRLSAPDRQADPPPTFPHSGESPGFEAVAEA